MICSNDDSGIQCKDCLCNFNPVVVIATHERKDITTKNINSLKKQSIAPKIVIVCSDQRELEYYKTLGFSVILEPNKPLGKKWQAGVNVAMKLGANPLIILGSDDFLADGFIKNALLKLKSGIEFIGVTSWMVLDKKSNKIYCCQYINKNQNFPIGSGKVYSKSLLDRIKWKVFDIKADKRLDDQGFRLSENNNAKIELIRTPEILAYKGQWLQMNTIEAYLRSPNIKCEVINSLTGFSCVE